MGSDALRGRLQPSSLTAALWRMTYALPSCLRREYITVHKNESSGSWWKEVRKKRYQSAKLPINIPSNVNSPESIRKVSSYDRAIETNEKPLTTWYHTPPQLRTKHFFKAET